MYGQNFHGCMKCYLKPGTPHCGPTVADYPLMAEFKFAVTVHYPEGVQLDENGFLLDNTYFQNYFDSFKGCQVACSCEQLVQLVADDIARDAKQWNAHVHVTIHPVVGMGVSMSAAAGPAKVHKAGA
jgi:hypothetical protein